MKKAVVVMMSLLLCVCSLCGCGMKVRGKPASNIEASIDVDENVSATLKVAVKNDNEEKQLIKSVAEVFNKTYKNVKVEIIPFSNEVYSYMMSQVKTEEVPDIVIATSFDMFQLNNSSILRNLQPYIDAETEAGQFDINDYYTMFMRAGQEGFDGDQYLIPRSADRVVCHYNVDLLNKANTWYKTSDLYDASVCENLSELVVNGWTWDDFMFVCSVIRGWLDSQDKKTQYIVDSSFSWEAVWNPVLTSFGVEYIGDNKKVLIDSQNTREALEFMRSMVDKRYTSSTSANFYGGNGVFFFHSQAAKAAAQKVGTSAQYYNQAQAGKYSEYYNVVSMPVREGHEAIGAGVAGYVVSAASEVPNIAWKFLKTLLTQEGQDAMSKDSALNYVPVRKDMADATKWAWGEGLEGVNLSAFTCYAGIGDDPDWNCFTDFFLKKPSQALNLLDCVETMVSSYVFDKAATIELNKVINDCVSSLTGFLNMR